MPEGPTMSGGRAPPHYAGTTLSIGASAGAALLPLDNPADVLERRRAMYERKAPKASHRRLLGLIGRITARAMCD